MFHLSLKYYVLLLMDGVGPHLLQLCNLSVCNCVHFYVHLCDFKRDMTRGKQAASAVSPAAVVVNA